ncbi:MAG: RHS repeat-associated core domain-containing protein [Prosthecobacter sp.]|nr:RHS repeat-associated core domain-containing protein [Prosthecobacter sp.]
MLTVLMTKKTLNLRVWLALAGWLLLPQILVSSPWVNGATRAVEYDWDAWDRLREVKVPTTATAQKIYRYSYDYRMRRIAMAQTGGGLTTRHTAVLYSGGLSVVEYNRTNNNTITNSTLSSMQYVRGPDMGGGVGGLLYTFRRSGDSLVQRFNLSNGRGDIVAQTSNTGALTWTASYEAYGKQTKETGTNNDRQRANSKEEDPTGLLNEGHRYRDLETGVWMSRDPAGFVDGPNLYAYVKQNPWTSFDPDGLKAVVYFKNQEDYDHATKVQKNSKDGGFYKDARLVLLKEKDPRNVIFDKSTPTKINGVVEGGVRYDKGSFVGTDAAWFFDNTTHAKSITDWFNLGGSLADISRGVLANIGNGAALTASAQITSKTSIETIKQVEKAAAAKAEQAAADVMTAAKFSKPAPTNPVIANMFKESPEAAVKMRDSLPAAEKEMWAKHFSDVASKTKSEAGRLLNEARAAFLRGQTQTPPGNITNFQKK